MHIVYLLSIKPGILLFLYVSSVNDWEAEGSCPKSGGVASREGGSYYIVCMWWLLAGNDARRDGIGGASAQPIT